MENFIKQYNPFFKKLKQNLEVCLTCENIKDVIEILNHFSNDPLHGGTEELEKAIFIKSIDKNMVYHTLKNDLKTLKNLDDRAKKKFNIFGQNNRDCTHLYCRVIDIHIVGLLSIFERHFSHFNIETIKSLSETKIIEDKNSNYSSIDNETVPLESTNKNVVKELPEVPNNVEQHPEFDPNLWNEHCYQLFKYLKDNYYTKRKRQITNIWFFLKENKPSRYNLKATKDQYKEFIKTNYSIEISNFDKAQAKYEDTEFQTMYDWRIKFEDTLK